MNNIYSRIAAVMADVQYLQKDDKVSYGSTSYRAMSEEKVTETVRKSLLKNGLVIFPIEQEHKREDTITPKGNVERFSTVNVKYKIACIDTGESEVIVSSGTGVDSQDKGVGKAMTYAYKYMLLRTFAIPTGEDTDKISSEELDAQFGKASVQNREQQSSRSIPTQMKQPTPEAEVIAKLSKDKDIVAIAGAKKINRQTLINISLKHDMDLAKIKEEISKL